MQILNITALQAFAKLRLKDGLSLIDCLMTITATGLFLSALSRLESGTNHAENKIYLEWKESIYTDPAKIQNCQLKNVLPGLKYNICYEKNYTIPVISD